jgi:hypothetical protein
MRNLMIFGMFIIAMILVQFTQAQTVDEVVDKYVAALGGKEKLAALKTIKMEGTMSVQGNDLAITSTRMHNVGIRMDIDVAGMSNYQVANRTKGSAFWPVRGQTEPQDMEPEQFRSAQNQMDVQGALFNYKEKGTRVELMGKETVDGAEAYNLKVTFKNGLVSNYYVDTKTSRLAKTSSKIMSNGQEVEQSSSFSDYKQNADGYWFAYSITTSQGTVVYDKISTNIPVDESLFKN